MSYIWQGIRVDREELERWYYRNHSERKQRYKLLGIGILGFSAGMVCYALYRIVLYLKDVL